MATPNYGYEKRQRELAKKKKKEDKLKAKANRQQHDADAPEGSDTGAPEAPDDASAGGDGAAD
ncbi:hypothetical protein [Hydrogenophaga laconesensis]|uniref:Uncharacterized protein n=1 Tax=Hydrogenophaga laconesensis TaxID=1805971 RepID=A0ABU1V4R1_9BURK|nr:hypothetical protein [Hydrogenophaga laconesensis]MDR7092442.1 hypothetical protein [Hydrogenophaga laconesensis]